MDPWFDPSNWGNAFSFSPLPADDAPLSEEQAVEIANRSYYVERWPEVQIATQYGLFAGGGTSLVLPPDFPKPPYPPGGWDSLSPRELHAWTLQREEWHRDAEQTGEFMTHRNRLVWLVAFMGIQEPDSPTKKARVKAIDAATRRVLEAYHSALSVLMRHAG